jgi:hypothetical protein
MIANNLTTAPGTDGLIPNRVGMGIYGPSLMFFEALGSTLTIFLIWSVRDKCVRPKFALWKEGIKANIFTGGSEGTQGIHLQVQACRWMSWCPVKTDLKVYCYTEPSTIQESKLWNSGSTGQWRLGQDRQEPWWKL